MAAVPEISGIELKEAMAAQTPLVLLDVREPHELEISRLDGIIAIPLGELLARFGALDPAIPTVVICRSGMRSARATEFLLGQGFSDVRNLVGGMNAYATEVDTSLSVY